MSQTTCIGGEQGHVIDHIGHKLKDLVNISALSAPKCRRSAGDGDGDSGDVGADKP